MNWLHIDPSYGRPSNSAVEGIKFSLTLYPIQKNFFPIDKYLEEIRRAKINGGAIFAQFEVAGNNDFEWFATRNRWNEMDFFRNFLAHPVLCQELPELTRNSNLLEPMHFEQSDALILDGELARALLIGGAYRHDYLTPKEAKVLGGQVCNALFGDRFDEVLVFHYWKAWSQWFYDVAWDDTTLVIDKRLRVLSLFCSTDTD